jgi:hypothetical protein
MYQLIPGTKKKELKDVYNQIRMERREEMIGVLSTFNTRVFSIFTIVVQQLPQSSFRTFPQPKKLLRPIPNQSLLPYLAPDNQKVISMISVSIDLLFMDILYKWNQAL